MKFLVLLLFVISDVVKKDISIGQYSIFCESIQVIDGRYVQERIKSGEKRTAGKARTLPWSQCQYENPTNTLGIGLVEYNNDNHPPVFEAYNDPELTDKFCSWNIYDESEPPFCAKFHKPDYGIIQVVVLDSLPQAYKILVNENDIKYLPRNLNYIYRSWEEYLMQSHGVRRKLGEAKFKNYPIRNQPQDSSRIIQLPKEPFELLCVMEVNGDWIKVKYDCFYNQNQNPNEGLPCSGYIKNCLDTPTGWLKWRIRNEITVDIFLMP